jgi:hypothetical protein
LNDETEARERYQAARRVFLQVLARGRSERHAALEALCGADAGLRQEVESLLAHAGSDTDHLLPPPGTGGLPAAVEQQLAGLRGERRARFEPGQRFGDRYLLHERIGEGGMGEVWSAQDRMLGERVALKFIGGSQGEARHAAWIERLLGEASAARKVTHGNVCRVHDVGTAHGEFFISMEFMPGRDLGAGLRETGRLDARGSRRLAHEVTSALVAIHRAGLLHRDLKPANILFANDGTSRLSDFGLAVAAAGIEDRDARSGTQAYMAPEVLGGAPPSARSDLYALGLVLYEAVTNRCVFRSGREVVRQAERGEVPLAPSRLVAGVDPVLDRVICRCLGPRPSDRPESAEQVLRVLECRDPLDAVMALGDAPSADIIAVASAQGLLGRRAAALVLATFFVLLGALLVLVRFGPAAGPLPTVSPEAAAERGRAMLEQLDGDGWHAASRRFSYGFDDALPPLDPWFERTGAASWRLALPTGDDRKRGFWLREASSPLCPTTWSTVLFGNGRVTFRDPPASMPDMRSLALAPDGRLLSFHSTTQRPAGHTGSTAAPSAAAPHDLPRQVCTAAFHLAGFDPQHFDGAPPLLRGDGSRQHAAWQHRGAPPVRIEAELAGSRLLAFHVLAPTEPDVHTAGPDRADGPGLANVGAIALLLAIALPLAWRHFRSGRGNHLGAARLALLCGSLTSASWYLVADYPGGSIATSLLYALPGLLLGLGAGGCIWLFYMAVEPSVQREWPRALVASGRLLRGRFRDPLVLSHTLLGLCIGLLAPLFLVATRTLAGMPMPGVDSELILSGSNPAGWLASPLYAPTGITVVALEFLAAITFLRFVCRSRPVAVGLCALLATAVLLRDTGQALDLVNAVLVVCLMLGVLLRLGMLAFFAMALPTTLFDAMPIARGMDDWYAGGSIVAVGGVATLAVAAGIGLLRKH